ncbi:MAG TPA: broad-spectrum mercury transporter MerE [Steroidobacteraceae bacterium]|nr:broad-spectrum mercury transporter MerE [Steroidobacteraceae bacterium]
MEPSHLQPPEQGPRWRAYCWGGLAVLTCPCHLLLLMAALAGTTAGATIEAHWSLAAVALATLFGLSLTQAWRAFNRMRPS